jgi:hypothetical protein
MSTSAGRTGRFDKDGEVHDDERAATVAAFTRRALDWFLELGVVAERILTDNHLSYVNGRAYRELLASRAIEHWKIRPYRQTNGKVERFHQTLARDNGDGRDRDNAEGDLRRGRRSS